MNLNDVYAAIKLRIETQWALLHPEIPMVFANEQRPTFDKAPTTVHTEVRTGATKTIGWGGGPGKNRQRQSGEVIFRVFVPADTSMETVIALAESCCSIVRYWDAPAGLRFFDAGPTGGGEQDKDGVFFTLDAIASFFFDTIG